MKENGIRRRRSRCRGVFPVWLALLLLSACKGSLPDGFAPEAQVLSLPVKDAGLRHGSSSAPVTLLELGSYRCGTCAIFHENMLPALNSEYAAKGRMRYVFVNIGGTPLDRQLESVSGCLSSRLSAVDVMTELFSMGQVGEEGSQVDREGLADCWGIPQAARLEDSKPVRTAGEALAHEAGIRVTPTFVVGRTDPAGTVTGWVIPGLHSIEMLRAYIEAAERIVIGVAEDPRDAS